MLRFILAFLVTTIGTVACAVYDSKFGLSPAYGYLAGAVMMAVVAEVISAINSWELSKAGQSGVPGIVQAPNGTVTVTMNGASVTIDRNGNISCVSTPGDFCMGSRS